MMRIFKEIAIPVVEEVTEKVGEEEYRKFVNEMKGYKLECSTQNGASFNLIVDAGF